MSAAEGEPSSEAADRDADPLAPARAAGIHLLAIPTPFQVGRVNAYLIEDEPLTLVDSGPNSGKALDELELALNALGHQVADLGLLIITHQHIDHIGLASILARRSGAEVASLDALAPYLRRFGEAADADDRFAAELMIRHGVSREVASALRAVTGAVRAWGSSVEVTRPLPDGGELRLRDRALRVLHRPGHSPSDTLFFDRERGIVFGGDHLIKHISSNPLIARPLDSPADYRGPRPRALIAYLDSMRATRELPARLVLPGHGEPITHHAALIDERVRLHHRRMEKIMALIEQRPLTAHEVAHELWGGIALTQAFLTLSEVLGHVDLLVNDGRVVEVEQDGVVRFEAAG